MDTKVIARLLLVLLFSFFCNHLCAQDLRFSLGIDGKKLELFCENRSGQTVRLPWLKRRGAAFVFVTDDGQLIPDKRWDFLPDRGHSCGAGFFCRFTSKRRVTAISWFPLDLSHLSLPGGLTKNKFSVLFVKAFVNSSLHADRPLFHTPFYILELTGETPTLSRVDRNSLPKGVFGTFSEEEKKIVSEEKNSAFGYW